MPMQTLEQRRAMDAWEKSKGCGKEYAVLVKGLSPLIMNSGLLQVVAFLNEKGKSNKHHQDLMGHLLQWLAERFPEALSKDFDGFMEGLMSSDPQTFQAITAEAFTWLRWMRQMAPARVGEE